jgi:putative heme-binding domain-containing protein
MHGVRPLLWAAASFFIVAALSAQNSPQDPQVQPDHFVIETGARLYGAQCSACHGVNGDQINGVDLRANRFLTVRSDEDLTRLLATGRPAAGMPGFAVLHTDEAAAIIAYIRSNFDASTEGVTIGDSARGAMVFDGKGGCASCHRVDGRGAYSATDLTEIGTVRTPASLQRALVDPGQAILPANRPVRAVTKDGRSIRGRRINEDTYTLQLIDEQSRLVSVSKADLRSFELLSTSSMPSFENTLTADERADVVAYLLSLKGGKP